MKEAELKEKILEADISDKQNYIIKKDGVTYPDNTVITDNFTNYQIGTCRNFEWKDNEFYGEIELRDDIGKINLKDKIFRVEGLATEHHLENGINVVDEFGIKSVSLINKENDVYD